MKNRWMLLLASFAALACFAPNAAADPVRYLDGEDDQIRVRANSATNVTGAMTMAVLLKPEDLGVEDLMSLHTSGGSGSGYDLFQDGSAHLGLGVGANVSYGTAPLHAGEWQLLAVSKATGTSTPRFHVYRYSTGEWDHRNGSATLGSGGSIAGGTIRFGAWEDEYNFDGEYAAAGLFSRALADGEVEDLAGSYEEWLEAGPAGMWLFNQSDLTKPVLDETGGGADELPDETVGTEVRDNQPLPTGDPDETIFRGDLSRGNTGEWGEIQKVGSTAALSVGSSSPTPPAGESYFGRFELKKNDERAELASGLHLFSGEDVYFRFWARLEKNFPAEEGPGIWGQLIWQLHDPGIVNSPALALYIAESKPGRYALADSTGTAWWLGPNIDYEKWHEFVIRVNHSFSNEVGFAEVWMDGVQQTLANSMTRYYGATLIGEYNYFKTGYYRDSDMVGTGVVEIAGYRVSRSLEDLP